MSKGKEMKKVNIKRRGEKELRRKGEGDRDYMCI